MRLKWINFGACTHGAVSLTITLFSFRLPGDEVLPVYQNQTYLVNILKKQFFSDIYNLCIL